MLELYGIPILSATGLSSLFPIEADGRIRTIGSEPSDNSKILCVLALPFVISKCRAKAGGRFYVYLVALLALIFFVSSTQCYFTFAALLLGVVVFYGRHRISPLALAIICTLLAVLGFSFLVGEIGGFSLIDSDALQNLYYLAVEKLTDSSNMSTVYRYSTVFNDLIVFLKFPIFGCGDGIQGFYYNENISLLPGSSTAIEVIAAVNGEYGVIGAGGFLPGLISSSGIVGMAVFLWCVVKGFRLAKTHAMQMGSYYDMLVLMMFAILPNMFIGSSIHACWPVYIVLSMPYIALRFEGSDKEERA